MLGSDFYHSLLKKYVTIFGLIFDSISISRFNSEGQVTERFKIPLAYAAKDKLLARVIQDPALNKPTSIDLPRMGFEYIGMTYDGDRKLNRVKKRVRPGTDANHFKIQYVPTPYNIQFALYIMVKNTEDGTKIIEQILPFFCPDFTATAHLVPEMDITEDIPIVLNGVSIEDRYEGALTERQVLIYTLSFTMKGYFYGPIVEKPIIKFVKFQQTVGNTSDGEVSSRLSVWPGLDANGDPTSVFADSIDPNEIEYDSNYGFIVQKEVVPFEANTFPFDRTDLEE